jgi:hypothetical protein
MTQSEYWSVTAYLLKINGVDPGPMLNEETAAQIQLGGKSAAPAALTPITTVHVVPEMGGESPSASPFWTIAIIAGVVLALIGLFSRFRRPTS